MNQMRELFEKEYPLPEGASFNGSFYTAPYPAAGVSDHNVRWAAWEKAFQAAQSVSVPVVGDVAAYMSADGDIEYSEKPWMNTGWQPLIVQPATSISAAELDALRKDAERWRKANEGGKFCIAEWAAISKEWADLLPETAVERVDAAIAGETK